MIEIGVEADSIWGARLVEKVPVLPSKAQGFLFAKNVEGVMLTTHGMGKTRVSYYAVQASWLLLGLCLISAGPGVALTQYAIGQIPDQTAYHGYTRSFEVFVVKPINGLNHNA